MIETGIRQTGQGHQKPHGCLSISAQDLTQRKAVSARLRNNSTTPSLHGRLRRSPSTRTNGLKRMGGAVEPMRARGFSILSLSEGQMNKLHRLEISLPDGRYCQAFEILSYFKTPNRTIKPEADAAMAQCYQEWLASHDNDNRETGLLYQQKIHKWDRFVVDNYAEPLPAVSTGGWNS